jgi:hypothetical protein
MYGCTGAAIAGVVTTNINVITGAISGDTTFATTTVVVQSGGTHLGLFFDSVDMSGVGTGLAKVTTQVFSASAAFVYLFGRMNNCLMPSSVPTMTATSKNNLSNDSYLGYEKFNQTAGDHRLDTAFGLNQTDTSIFNAASPSEKMTPRVSTSKLVSAPKNYGVVVPVANGQALTVNVTVRKSAVGDGAAYNGNQPRLIQRQNSALGQNADVVLATYSSGTGSWNTLTGTSSTAGDDGAWEFIVDCDGTAGWINVDDWSFTNVAVTSKGVKNWFNGSPNVMAGGAGGAPHFSVSIG